MSQSLLIFAQGRTGSTLLEDLLYSTGYFQKHGEILNCEYQEEVKDPVNHIKTLSQKCYPKIFLGHIKIYHLTEDRKYPVDPAYVLQELGCPVIYLYREDHFRHALSNLVLEKHRIPVNYQDNRRLSIHADPKKIEAWIAKRIRWREQEEACLQQISNPVIRVCYETDLLKKEAHLKTVNTILRWLHLSQVSTVFTRLRKTVNVLENPSDFESV